MTLDARNVSVRLQLSLSHVDGVDAELRRPGAAVELDPDVGMAPCGCQAGRGMCPLVLARQWPKSHR